MIVLDTNVVSELMRPSPDPRVTGWADRQVPAGVVTGAVTVAEIGDGIARLAAGRRRELLAAAEEVFGACASRVLPLTRLQRRTTPASWWRGNRQGRRRADSMRRSLRSVVPTVRGW